MQPSDTIGKWQGSGLPGIDRGAAYDRGMPAQSSSSQQFEAEAMPHLNDLFRTAVRVLGDRVRAEDVVQEVYLQAWKSFHRFESGTNCRAWLFKILFHCINHHRRKWFRFPLLRESEEFLEVNLTAVEPVPEHLTDQDILSALDQLPAELRDALPGAQSGKGGMPKGLPGLTGLPGGLPGLGGGFAKFQGFPGKKK